MRETAFLFQRLYNYNADITTRITTLSIVVTLHFCTVYSRFALSTDASNNSTQAHKVGLLASYTHFEFDQYLVRPTFVTHKDLLRTPKLR